MKKIAITGNIASGKSEVEKIISELGFKILDTDKVSHDILNKDDEAKKEILSIFGSDILDNGSISRKKLAEIVFKDKDKLTRLEKIIHPLVFKKIGEFFAQNKNEEMCFVSIPQLFETRTQAAFDKVLLISAKEETRLKRLMKRNNLSEDEARLRIDIQMSESLKISKSDFVIYNDKDLNYLKEQVNCALTLLRLLP
ncbi:dephospho-CoA kinase [bacterium]|nr:dephospho-CoA kinase [bacterium]